MVQELPLVPFAPRATAALLGVVQLSFVKSVPWPLLAVAFVLLVTKDSIRVRKEEITVTNAMQDRTRIPPVKAHARSAQMAVSLMLVLINVLLAKQATIVPMSMSVANVPRGASLRRVVTLAHHAKKAT